MLFGRPIIAAGGISIVVAVAVVLLFSSKGGKPAAVGCIVVLAFLAIVAGARVYVLTHGLGHETISVEHVYDFLRPDGSLVLVHTRARVRFNHDTVSLTRLVKGPLGYIEQVSTKGGRLVDRLRADDQQWALFSLGELKKRGEVATVEVTRTLVDSFLKEHEYVVYEPAERPRSVCIRLGFPPERPARNVKVTRIKRSGRRVAQSDFSVEYGAGRTTLTFCPKWPREDTSYVIEWDWAPLEVVVSHPDRRALLAGRIADHFAGRTVNLLDVRQRASAIHSAPGVILLVDGDRPDDAQRADWIAVRSLERRRAATVVVVGKAEVPPELDDLPRVHIDADPGPSPRALEAIRAQLWAGDEERPLPAPTDSEAQAAAESLRRRAKEAQQRAARTRQRDLAARREELEGRLATAPDGLTEANYAYDLGLVLAQLGDTDGAQRRFQRAAELREALDNDNGGLAEAIFNLGRLAVDRGDLGEAERLYARAADVGERAFGRDHAKVRLYRKALNAVRAEKVVS